MSPNDSDGGERHPGGEPGVGALARRVLDRLPVWLGAHLALASITVALALGLASGGGALHLALAALVVAYLLGMAQLGRRTHARLVAAARLEDENRELVAAVREKSAHLAATFDHVHQGVAVFDRDHRLVTWNPRHPELHGYPPELYRQGTPLQAFLAADLERAGASAAPCDRDEDDPPAPDRPPAPARFELPGAGERILEVERGPLPGGGFVATSTDITLHKRAEARMLYLAQHDSLTGLPNRLLFHDRLRLALARCRRDRTDLAVLLLDLDNFKQVNDALGHRVGDRILEEVAARLRAGLRESDTVARIGGDEFALILPVLPQTEAAAVVARKILTRLETTVAIEDRRVALRASLGLALFPHDGDTPELLLQNADLAMYRAKAAGGGFRPFAAGIRREFDHRLSLERELQHAIERGQLSLEYQPLLDLRDQSITGVEALLRWRHPELGEVGPETLIRAAEGSGQIGRIGAWILSQACTAATTWRCDGRPLRVAVNLSGVQLRDPNLVELIRRILEETGWPAQQLELELTETGPIGEIGAVAPMVERLRELGVSLAIDDFGAGHTGLGHLRQLPLDALKIDRSLVTGLEREADAAIAGSLIELGHRLRLRVVAEGVETAAQLAILERLGCDEAQGHIVGPPASSAEMAARLEAARAVG